MVMHSKPTIALVDDHVGIIESVGYTIVHTLPEFEIATLSGWEECRKKLVALNPVVVIVDWRMEGVTGDIVKREFEPMLPAAKWILFTAYPRGFSLQTALDSGFNSCVGKMSGFNELTKAVREVLAGQAYFCPEAQRGMAKLLREDDSPKLTGKERDILRCIAAGMEAKEIAQELGIAVRTVHNYLATLRQKTGAAGMVQMGYFAVAKGIAPEKY